MHYVAQALVLLGQQVSLSLPNVVQLVTLIGALGAIFLRIGKFETKTELGAQHIKESVERLEKSMNDKIESEVKRLTTDIGRVDTSQKVQTWEVRFMEMSTKLDNLSDKVEGNTSDIEKLRSKQSGTMQKVTP